MTIDPRDYKPDGPLGLTIFGNSVPKHSGAGGLISTDIGLDSIVEGNFYSAGFNFLQVLDQASVQMVVVVPADAKDGLPPGAEFGAIGWQVIVEAKAVITFTAGISTTADGTPVPIFNHNENSLKTPRFTVFRTPTAPTGGTNRVTDLPIFAGERNASIGGIQQDLGLRILEPATKYLLSVKNLSGGPSDIWLGGVGLQFIFQ